jgi:hypothetical protein
VPFSLERLEVTNENPFKVADGTDPSVGDGGTLLYLEGTSVHDPTTRRLVWLDQDGKAEPIVGMRSTRKRGRVSFCCPTVCRSARKRCSARKAIGCCGTTAPRKPSMMLTAVRAACSEPRAS